MRERSVEVLNFGVSGYGTAQELLTLRQRVWSYEPDLVLLAFFTGNDVADNHAGLHGAAHVPYYVYEDGRLRLDASFTESAAYRKRDSTWTRTLVGVSRYSRLLQLANRLRSNMARKAELEAFVGENGKAGVTEYGLYNAIYVEPPEADWQEAWRVTEGLLGLMKADCDERGVRFAVVTLTNGIQVHPDAQHRASFRAALEVEDLFYPDRRIQEAGRRLGFPVLNLAPRLQSRAEAEQVYLHGFDDSVGIGHWNETGHRWGGEEIARWLRADVLAGPR